MLDEKKRLQLCAKPRSPFICKRADNQKRRGRFKDDLESIYMSRGFLVPIYRPWLSWVLAGAARHQNGWDPSRTLHSNMPIYDSRDVLDFEGLPVEPSWFHLYHLRPLYSHFWKVLHPPPDSKRWHPVRESLGFISCNKLKHSPHWDGLSSEWSKYTLWFCFESGNGSLIEMAR